MEVTEALGQRFVFTDIETTGLDSQTDLTLEIGFRITDLDLNLIDDFDVTIWDSPYFDTKKLELETLAASGEESAVYVLEMHTKNGLWEACQSGGLVPVEAETQVMDFLTGHGVGKDDPMVGSSVHFDRKFFADQFPMIERLFSHRNIDISSIKEICKRLAPDLYGKLEKYGPPKREIHRVLPDMEDSAEELRWYIENFLWIDAER